MGRCRRCGGKVVATHMLTRTYDVGEDGRWRRQLDEFLEDVVVVCATCGNEPDGRFEADASGFAFVPANGPGGNTDGESNTHEVPK